MSAVGTQVEETGTLLREASGFVLRRNLGGRWKLDLHRVPVDHIEKRVRITGTFVGDALGCIDIQGFPRALVPMLPGKASDPGRTTLDNRLFVNGVLWVLRSGARWSDLPERYGKYKTVRKRFTRWAAAGVWEGIFTSLARDRDNEYLMIDSSIVRAHAQAATGQKGGLGD